MEKIDPIHQQRQRELIVSLLRAYGVRGNLDDLSNAELMKLLEKTLTGVL